MWLPSVLAALVLSAPALATPLPDVDLKLKSGQRALTDAAVVIGIEEYPFLPHVPYARRDADAFWSFLIYTRGIPPARLSLLNQNPTATDMREAIRQRAAEVGPDGTLWVYFAGHGAADPETGERLLLGVDVQPKVSSLTETHTVGVDEVGSLAAAASKVVIVVDACYTGTGRDGKVLLEGKRYAVPSYAAAPPLEVVTWTAAGPSETSGPLEPAQHGLFTYFVIGALRGWADGEFDDRRDGTVTLEEASQFVTNAVRAVGGGEQTPVLEGATSHLSAPIVRGSTLEAAPDLAEIVQATRPSGSTEKPSAPAVAVAVDGSFAQKLAELKRLQAERAATEARERELAEQVAAERSRQVESATAAILAEATDAWSQTVPMLEAGGEEARMAAQLFVDTYGAVRVVVEGVSESVKVPEVATARSWLAQHGSGPVAPEAVATELPPSSGIDPLAGIGTLSDHPLWELPWTSEKLAKKLGGKVRRDSWDDEVWGDAGDKALAKGDTDLATYFYLHAQAIDPFDGEWDRRLVDLGTTGANLAALADRLRVDPSSDEAWGDLGDGLAAEFPADACASYVRALELDPTDEEWNTKVSDLGCGSISAATGSALADARAAAEADPGNDERVGDLADALMDAGQVAEACVTYQRALDLDPSDSEWPGKLLGCLETDLVVTSVEGDGASADDLLAQLRSSYGGNGGVQGILASLDPTEDEHWGDLGDAVLAEGDQALAVDLFRRAMELDPTDREWQHRLAELAGYDTLFAAFRGVIARDPANDELLGDYGDRLTEHGDREQACQAYRSAARFDPSDTEWASRVAECDGTAAPAPASTIAGLQRDDASLAVLADQLEADPDNDERWGDYADGLVALGRTGAACDAYVRANAIDPADSEWIDAISNHGCSGALAATPVQTEELDDEAVGDRGDELAASGDLAGACEQYRQALEIDPNDREWSDKLVRCMVATNDDESLGDLGDRLAGWGHLDRACVAYKEALRIDPKDQEWKDRRADCRGVE